MELLEEIAEHVAARAGLRPPAWVLEQRVAERARARGVDAAAYAALLVDDDAELHALVEALRVGETRFFRHRAQVEALSRVVVPALVRAGARRVRAWSAGCATGEEAYTLAMLLSGAFADVSVLGTDISEEALARARDGRYRGDAAEHVPDALRRRFIATSDDEARVAPSLARLVRFERRNLLAAPPPGAFDVILCRNVLMYFDAPTRTAVVERLADSLSPSGFLLLGYAETARHVASLVPVDESGVYRRATPPSPVAAGRLLVAGSSSPAPLQLPSPTPPSLRLTGAPTPDSLGALLRDALAADRIVIDLDGAELLDDALVPVLRRAAAAARASGGRLTLTATRPGPRRWLERHKL